MIHERFVIALAVFQVSEKGPVALFVVMIRSGFGVMAVILSSLSADSISAQEDDTDSDTLQFDGYVRPSREAVLSPLVNNAVTHIGFHAGQLVEEGQLLFEFGKKAPQIELRLSETALKDARASLRLAEAELDRKTELYLKELISEAEFQVHQVRRDMAEIAAERAQLVLEAAQLVYSFTEIRAPFSGIISEPQVKQYQYLSTERSGDEVLAVLADIDPIHVVVKVPYQVFAERRKLFETDQEAYAGIDLSLKLGNEQEYGHAGHYFGGSFAVDPETQLIDLWAEFPNPDHLLRPGAKVSVVSRLRD